MAIIIIQFFVRNINLVYISSILIFLLKLFLNLKIFGKVYLIGKVDKVWQSLQNLTKFNKVWQNSLVISQKRIKFKN